MFRCIDLGEFRLVKDIKGYEGLYAVTSCGKVWSYRTSKFLKPEKTNNGYLRVSLARKQKYIHYFIHRLVAQAYLENPSSLPQVNHKDEDKTNNSLNNLEWASVSTNINYGTRNAKISKIIYCVELNKTFKSITEAGRELKISPPSICCVLKHRGYSKTAGGYHWRYVN